MGLKNVVLIECDLNHMCLNGFMRWEGFCCLCCVQKDYYL